MAFSDYPGESTSIALLQRSLQRGRLAHAYLLVGGDAQVLEHIALTLAKTLNCQGRDANEAQPENWDSCDQCLACRKIDHFNHADVAWVRPESKSRVITIHQMREVMKNVHLKPTEAPFKVVIATDAERMNAQAANAFLKTLEEPPDNSVLILLSTEPQRLLETILSRCIRLTFSGQVQHRLVEDHAPWIAKFSDSLANAESGVFGRYNLLGSLTARLADLKSDVTKSLSAQSPLEQYEELEPKQREKLEQELAAGIESEYRRQRSHLIGAIHWWLRDVWLLARGEPSQLLSYPQFESGSGTVAGRISVADAIENLRNFEQLQRLMNSNVQEALALEVSLLKLRI